MQVDRDNLQHIADQLLSHLAPPTTSQLPSAISSLRALASSSPKPGSSSTSSSALSSSPAYRLVLTQRLLSMIAYDTYANVTDFGWVVSVLVDVARVARVDVGDEVRGMLMDVVARVKSVRRQAVGVLEKVLGEEAVLSGNDGRAAEAGVRSAAVWICGEYAR